MDRFLLPLLFAGFSFAAGVEDIFPTPRVDFLILTSKSFAVCNGKHYGVKTYRLTPKGKNLYRVELLLERGGEEKTEHLLFLKVKVRRPTERKVISFDLWYRGGRFAVPMAGDKALALWDLSPKCRFKREGNYLIPQFEKLKRKVGVEGCEVELVFTFTRCGF